MNPPSNQTAKVALLSAVAIGIAAAIYTKKKNGGVNKLPSSKATSDKQSSGNSSSRLPGTSPSLKSNESTFTGASYIHRNESNTKNLDTIAEKEIAEVPEGYVLTDKVAIREVHLAEVAHLGAAFPSAGVENKMRFDRTDDERNIEYNQLLEDDDVILYSVVRKGCKKTSTKAFLRAGPRPTNHFEPKTVKAAIVTCGGLCPGLNNVIREITLALRNLYGCTEVYGIRGGYNGFFDSTLQPIELTPEVVDNIHLKGGTILGSARGGFDLEKILQFLEQTGVNQLYVCGGDGTHRGAHKIATECLRRNLNVAVAGVPKTIDNDIGLIDRSFGFQTAVEAAQAAIQAAKVEAQCNIPRGIGIVKLMGRSSGFIASHAALASADVDLCLVPEVPLVPDGPQGFLPHLRRRVMEKGHAVVVLAEGAGEDVLGQSAEVDAGGNRKLPAVGDWVKKQIETYFSGQGMPATVKYIDPSYMIRSVPANAADSLYCSVLGQNAVHGAMAGYTAFSVGLVNNRMVWIPMPILTDNSPRVMAPHGRTWERVLSATHQPNTVPPDAKIDKMVTTRTVM